MASNSPRKHQEASKSLIGDLMNYKTKNNDKLSFLRKTEALGLEYARFEYNRQVDVELEAREDLNASQKAVESFILRMGDYEDCFKAINEGLGGNFAGTTSELYDILENDCLLFPSDGRAYSIFKHYGQALIAYSIAVSDRKDLERCILNCERDAELKERRKARKERMG